MKIFSKEKKRRRRRNTEEEQGEGLALPISTLRGCRRLPTMSSSSSSCSFRTRLGMPFGEEEEEE